METKEGLPAQEEWDFGFTGKRDWGAQDWRACYYYEFARHPKLLKKIGDQFCKGVRRASFENNLRQSQRVAEPGRCSDVYRWIRFITLFPEWPDKPFTAINSDERRRRISIAAPRLSRGNLGPPVLQWDMNYIVGRYRDYAAIPRSDSEAELERFIEGELHGALWNGRKTISTYPGMEFACFEIDWTLGTTAIQQAFAVWVKDNEPHNIAGPRRKAPGAPLWVSKALPPLARDAEGHIWRASQHEKLPLAVRHDARKARETKNCQDALRHLGASRIWDGFKGNWPKIQIAFERDLSEMRTVMGSQYGCQSAWSRARTQTAKRLAAFNA